ncbi:MAG: acyl-[Lachnospiraceae bacterium]|nr:acyl-[acyl-carrier-protein] thioesterase [Lachnospiraceae bacterium]
MYSFDSKIRYSECDSEGKLTLPGLMNYFQDASTFQSELLGVGVNYLKAHHQVWVLSSWQIEVERYPRLCEDVEIGTFPYDFKAFLGSRNFFMRTKDGQYAAKANSLWSLLDTDTMRPKQPAAELLEKYPVKPRLEMDYASRKIIVPESGVQKEPVAVKKHHLDTNHHVNNGQYINIAMEYLPEGFGRGRGVRQLRAEYKMQAFLNDVLYPYVVKSEDGVIVSLRNEVGKPYVNVEFR